ncbi:hypothetical protein ABFX02_04G074500 [Erythranthe guttata]
MDNGKGNPGIAEGNRNYVPVKSPSHPFDFETCKEKKSSTNLLDSLPDELLFNILVHLPAEDIYDYAMLVCRKWYRMIRTRYFVHEHLQHSTPGLLLHNSRNRTTSFAAVRRGRIELSECSYTIRAYEGWDSCNGLILEYYSFEGTLGFHIINPATRKIFEIPRFSPQGTTIDHRWGIGYSAASDEYKVARTYANKVDDEDEDDLQYVVDIVTVGVDESWRRVCTQHLSPESKILLGKDSVTTEGFIHYMNTFDDNRVLTLNVETETITEYAIPDRGLDYKFRCCLSTGKSLSMLGKCGEGNYWEVWEMKSETGEWTEMYSIDLEAHKSKLDELYGKKDRGSSIIVPMGWLKYHEVLILRFLHSARFHIAYNVRTREIDSLELACDSFNPAFRVHTNSLLGLV